MKNMKKWILFTLTAAILLPWNLSTAKAATDPTNSKPLTDTTQTTITSDNNGGYFVETLENTLPSWNTSTISASVLSTTTPTTTMSKTKTVKYYNSKNVLCWSYSLTATFNVKRGISSNYKSSKASLNNYNSWSIVSESHSGSSTKATGTIKMKKNGTTISKTVTILCDKYGNFS
ncbi:MAG: hypothetical protein K2J67_00325 [Lachnospiraceae bacterium]|nr:hypothetical protein [Lachnospiraceae bacterium]